LVISKSYHLQNLVSIIIPCFNQAQYLPAALQSILEQSYTNWECIIVNDGSQDNTEEIAQLWLKKDNRFRYFYKQNGGLSSARNLGLDIVAGNFVQFLDCDDVLHPEKLKASIEKCEAEPLLVISNFEMFIDDPQNTSEPYCVLNKDKFTYENILYNWGDGFSIPIHCGFFSINFFKEFKFSETLRAKEDWIMWVTFLKNNPTIIFINKPLALYRKNAQSMTMTTNMLDDQIKAYQILKNIVSASDFNKITIVLISRYYTSSSNAKQTIRQLKASNTYKGGKLVKKILRKIGMIKPFRYLLLKIEKWNVKINKNK